MSHSKKAKLALLASSFVLSTGSVYSDSSCCQDLGTGSEIRQALAQKGKNIDLSKTLAGRCDKKHSGEAKCGEGKCGKEKASEAKCGEGKCGEEKAAEGKCGEGKCGEKKESEAKCGEGKCGEADDKHNDDDTSKAENKFW